MPYGGISISRIRRDLAPGSRLSVPEIAPRRLFVFGKLLIPHIGNRDFQISATFGSWLTPSGPGVSAWALTFCEIVNAFCWYYDFQISARFGSCLTPFGPGVSA